MSNFLELVKVEREKQIKKHGYTPEHDDEHTDGSIADAAACYAANSLFLFRPTEIGGANADLSCIWPWEDQYFKEDKSRKEQLIIAAAMLMAEYERLERIE
ncbi:MAG: hypothetical protein AB1332_09780 [Pseudomonadota bacterium]